MIAKSTLPPGMVPGLVCLTVAFILMALEIACEDAGWYQRLNFDTMKWSLALLVLSVPLFVIGFIMWGAA